MFNESNYELLKGALPWVKTVERVIQASRLKPIRGNTLYIASDCSGEHNDSKFEVISILFADIRYCSLWNDLRLDVRNRYLSDGRRMSFKNLGDRQRQAALVPFLVAANEIPGLLLAIAIHKSFEYLVTYPGFLESKSHGIPIQGKWKPREFEKMARIAMFVSIFTAHFCLPGQNCYWVSDEDAMFSNLDRSTDVTKLVSVFSSILINHNLGELGIGTTKIDEGDRLEEDIAAIPDLAAGAVSALFNGLERKVKGAMTNGMAQLMPDDLNQKTVVLMDWFGDTSGAMQKVGLFFNRNRDGAGVVGRFNQDIPFRI